MKIQLQNEIFQQGVGGIENYLYYFSKTLIRMGHDPTVFCAQNRPDLASNEVYEGIRIVRHPPFSFPRQLFPFQLRVHATMLRKSIGRLAAGSDAIVSRHPYYAYASCTARLQVPTVYVQAAVWPSILKMSYRTRNTREKLIFRLWRLPEERRLEQKVLKLADRVIVLSEIRKREICDFYRVPEERLDVIPPGIDLKRFSPNLKSTRLRAELSIQPEVKIVLTVCRLSGEKNIQALIRAFARVKDTASILVVVGDGPWRADLERLVADLGIRKRVRFAGFRTDVERFYSIADLFVLPSLYEGFGHVFLEAMASGVPCIGFASDYPNIIVASDEIIQNGRSGFLANPYSNADLAEKIETLMGDDEMRRGMETESRKICEDKFSWDRHVSAVIKTFAP